MNDRSRQKERYFRKHKLALTKVTRKYKEPVNWNRIYKPTAKKYWDAGLEIKAVPNKINPYSPWYDGAVSRNTELSEKSFEHFVNAYEYYNCSSETGRYVAFYVTDQTKKEYAESGKKVEVK